jgi:hypothetical protein
VLASSFSEFLSIEKILAGAGPVLIVFAFLYDVPSLRVPLALDFVHFIGAFEDEAVLGSHVPEVD